MRARIEAVSLPGDSEFTEEIRALFADLRQAGIDTVGGDCVPTLDVYETEETVVVRVDLPGVDPALVRIIVRGAAILVAGVKPPKRGGGDASFHLVERGFGRFARSIRLMTPCDTGKARATLAHGELTVTLPKIPERRSRRAITVPVSIP